MGRGIGTATRMAPVGHGDGDDNEAPPEGKAYEVRHEGVSVRGQAYDTRHRHERNTVHER